MLWLLPDVIDSLSGFSLTWNWVHWNDSLFWWTFGLSSGRSLMIRAVPKQRKFGIVDFISELILMKHKALVLLFCVGCGMWRKWSSGQCLWNSGCFNACGVQMQIMCPVLYLCPCEILLIDVIVWNNYTMPWVIMLYQSPHWCKVFLWVIF